MTERRSLLALATSLVAAIAFAACGAGDDARAVDATDGSAPDASGDPLDAGLGASDARVPDAGLVRAPFGLDGRPPNPTCIAPARPPAAGPVKLERVYANLNLGFMMGMTTPPGDPTRWFAISLDGIVYSFPVVAPAAATIVADLKSDPTYPVVQDGESGLLGLAFHPKFAQNGRAYVSYGTNGGPPPGNIRSMVARIVSTDGGLSFGPPTPIVGPFDQPRGVHMGGGIAFGRDGYLYASFGEGGDAYRGQWKDTFFAKVIRIDVDAAPAPGLAYAIPPDNPFALGGGEPATFARGFRNPFRMSIDRATGDVWLGDVGDAAWEEIDKVALGGNYGWPCREGLHDHPLADDPAACPSRLGLSDPVFDYDRGPIGSAAVAGGVVYRGKAMPSLVGAYIYGDYVSGELHALTFDPTTGAPKATLLNPTGPGGYWTAFSEDADGEVYAHDMVNGAIYRLAPAAPPAPSSFPDRLSKTGCFDPKAPAVPVRALVPFAPNAELWSDGAEKERYLAIPDGKTIHVDDGGHLDLPVGSVVVKTFASGGRRIETRLLVRHDDGEWAGYSYAWLDDQSDAVLLAADAVKTLPPGAPAKTWTFPSRSACVRCHTAAAGRTLGLEIPQLNRDHVYGNRLANELATLDHIGLFDAPLPAIATLPAYPSPFGSGPVDARARAYLHANCAMCHRPNGGAGRATMDLRYATPLASTKTCGEAPLTDAFGLPNAKVLAPGSPAGSMLSLRARALGAPRMPPLGTSVVDAAGLGVVDAWIASLGACP